jgi:hypothetical protein
MSYPAASCAVSRIQNTGFRSQGKDSEIKAPGFFSSNIHPLTQVDHAATCGELNPTTIKLEESR